MAEQEGMWGFWVRYRPTDKEHILHQEKLYRDIWAWAYDYAMLIDAQQARMPWESGILRLED